MTSRQWLTDVTMWEHGAASPLCSGLLREGGGWAGLSHPPLQTPIHLSLFQELILKCNERRVHSPFSPMVMKSPRALRQARRFPAISVLPPRTARELSLYNRSGRQNVRRSFYPPRASSCGQSNNAWAPIEVRRSKGVKTYKLVTSGRFFNFYISVCVTGKDKMQAIKFNVICKMHSPQVINFVHTP